MWYNFTDPGAAASQADNANVATVVETGEAGLTLPYDVSIVDIVLNKTATSAHEYQFFVNGKAQGSQFFAAQINPATQGRLNWANQRITISKGSRIQLREAQKDALGAEVTIVLVQFNP